MNLIHETLWHLSILPDDGGVINAGFQTAYAGLIVFCALDIANRDGLRSKVVGIGITALVVVIALTWFAAWPAWVETMLLMAPAAMLFAAAAVLVLGMPEHPMAVLWFAGLAALAGMAALVGEELVLVSAIEWNVFTDLVHLLIGVTLIMLTSERAIADISRKEQRIERYAEDRKRLELQFSHAQKLESLGMLAGGIAHDFNNMLTSILGYASLAMKKLPTDSDVRKDLYMVMSGARQAVDLTSQMLTYAGKGALDFESLDISKVVENMSSLMQSIVPKRFRSCRDSGVICPVCVATRSNSARCL
ncbi:MAG: histidine kinase dimerization/phospho-acceptor domain-containing protein [Gammaproteobacteria bacterium]|nr:histidine kinase dimerization/phospho-acceptor domain-containing protein [Gammaproteobacteria bacterium]